MEYRVTRTLANGRAVGPRGMYPTDDPGLQPGLGKLMGLRPETALIPTDSALPASTDGPSARDRADPNGL